MFSSVFTYWELLELLAVIFAVAMTVSLVAFLERFRAKRGALRRMMLLDQYIRRYENRILKLQASAFDYILSLGTAGVVSLADLRNDLEKVRQFADEVRELLIERNQPLTAYYLLRDNVTFSRSKLRHPDGKFYRSELSNWQFELERNIQRLGQRIAEVVASAAENNVRANAVKAFADLSDAGIEGIEPLREIIMRHGGDRNFFWEHVTAF